MLCLDGCVGWWHVSQRLWPKGFEPKALAADMKCDFRDLHDSTAHPPRIKFLNQYRLIRYTASRYNSRYSYTVKPIHGGQK